MKNKEGYPDPTAGAAIANIKRSEKRRKKKEEQHEQSAAKKITQGQKSAKA